MNGYEVRIEEREPLATATIRVTVPPEGGGELAGRLIAQLRDYLDGAGTPRLGPPYARTTWVPGDDLEVGLRVNAPIRADGVVVPGELPGGRVAVTWHTGPYDQLAGAHAAVEQWLTRQGLAPASLSWEFYHSDPRVVPDPKDWRTEVVCPVK